MNKLVKIHTLQDLETLAKAVSANLTKGDVLLLNGELGAGKTTFTRVLGKYLGAIGEIVSPTFTIAREYKLENSSAAYLIHIDAYRFSSNSEISPLDQLESLELDEIIPFSIVAIEWASIIDKSAFENPIEINITRGIGVCEDEFGGEYREFEIVADRATLKRILPSFEITNSRESPF